MLPAPDPWRVPDPRPCDTGSAPGHRTSNGTVRPDRRPSAPKFLDDLHQFVRSQTLPATIGDLQVHALARDEYRRLELGRLGEFRELSEQREIRVAERTHGDDGH